MFAVQCTTILVVKYLRAKSQCMSLESIPVSNVMTRTVITAKESHTVKAGARLMAENGIGSLVVVQADDDGVPVGIITEKDVVKLVATPQDLSVLSLRQVMKKPVITVDLAASIKDAILVMQAKNIRRLPVVEKGRMVGILTEKDIFRAIVKNQALLTDLISDDILLKYRPAYERLTEFVISEIYFPGGNR